MPTFKISTVDGKEIIIQHGLDDVEQIASLAKNIGYITGTEIIGQSGRSIKRGPVLIISSAITAIRKAADVT